MINIVSTSDSEAEVLAAMGKAGPSGSKQASEAADDVQTDETATDSETVENGDEEASEVETESDDQEADGDSDGDDDQEDDPKPVEKKPRNGFKKRIGKLTTERDSAKAEAQYWREQALKAQGKGTEDQQGAQKAPVADPSKPRPDQFESHEEYVEALTDWKTEQAFKARDAQRAQTEQQAKVQSLAKEYQNRVAEFKKARPDFDEVTSSADDVQVPPYLQMALLKSQHGPKIAYELCKDIDALERIVKLDPVDALREVGKIEARFEKPAPTRTVKRSKAPAPIAPIGGRSGSSAKKSIFDSDLSQAEYERMRSQD